MRRMLEFGNAGVKFGKKTKLSRVLGVTSDVEVTVTSVPQTSPQVSSFKPHHPSYRHFP